MLSNLVHAVAAPDTATVIALQSAISLNLGSAISFCVLFNCVRPNNPPTQKLIAITWTTNAPIARPWLPAELP